MTTDGAMRNFIFSGIKQNIRAIETVAKESALLQIHLHTYNAASNVTILVQIISS